MPAKPIPRQELFWLRCGSAGLFLGCVASASASLAWRFETPEFGMYGWGMVAGIPLGLALGAVAVLAQMLWVKLSEAFDLWRSGRIWVAPLLMVTIVVGMGLYTRSVCSPAVRLRELIGPEAEFAAPDCKVSGFNSFLAARWYARFSLPTNAVTRLRLTRGLTNQLGPELLGNLRQQSPYGAIAAASGTVPAWTAAVIWHRHSGEPSPGSQSVSWNWLAVDSTGTNCFYTRGYQN